MTARYDRNGELWKLSYGANRWSESPAQETQIAGLNAFMRVCDILVNVHTGTGFRLETFDVHPTRHRRGKVRRQLDLGRLTREGR